MKVHIVLFNGKGIISKLIEWQTRGEFSHAALLIDDTLYESWQGVGVRKKQRWIQPNDGTVALFEVDVSAQQKEDMLRFAERQLGKPYDYISVLRFVTREKGGEPGSWFCSEFVFCDFENADVHLFNECKGWEVPPDRLKWSTMATRIHR